MPQVKEGNKSLLWSRKVVDTVDIAPPFFPRVFEILSTLTTKYKG